MSSPNFRKVHKSALVVIPPQSLWDPIQEIRKVHDKAYNRWMPHVNLLYPFVEARQFSDALALVQKAASSIEPFQVKLSQFGHFGQRANCTMWLQPETKNDEMFHLQSALEAQFPLCDDVSNISGKGFTPHLSVGQFSKITIEQDKQNFQKDWKPIEFEVDRVYLIARTGFDDPFSIYYEVTLGANSCVIENKKYQPLSPKKSEQDWKKKVFVANLPFRLREEELVDIFLRHNLTPISATIVKKDNQMSKGYGFVDFSTEEDASKAIEELNGYNIDNREMVVKTSTPK